jgi:hypothetical protein
MPSQGLDMNWLYLDPSGRTFRIEVGHTDRRTAAEVITMLKSSIVCDITPCSPLKDNRCFAGTYRFHLQCRKVSRERSQRKSRRQAILSPASPACLLISRWFLLLGLFFDHEDGSDMFLRKVGWLSTDYTALYLRRQRVL